MPLDAAQIRSVGFGGGKVLLYIDKDRVVSLGPVEAHFLASQLLTATPGDGLRYPLGASSDAS